MSSPNTVLIVDDDPDVCRSLCALINDDYVNGVSVSSAGELFGSLDELQPACITLDFGLPCQDGFAILDQLMPRVPTTPVIIVTADGSVAARKRAMSLGAADFFEKPYEPSQLKNAILAAVELGCESRSSISFQNKFTLLPEKKQDLLLMMLSGFSSREVAKRVGVDEAELKKNLDAILASLGVSSISDARTQMTLKSGE